MYALWEPYIRPISAQPLQNNTWVEETMQDKIPNFLFASITDVSTHEIIAEFLARWQQLAPLLQLFHYLQSAGYESL